MKRTVFGGGLTRRRKADYARKGCRDMRVAGPDHACGGTGACVRWTRSVRAVETAGVFSGFQRQEKAGENAIWNVRIPICS